MMDEPQRDEQQLFTCWFYTLVFFFGFILASRRKSSGSSLLKVPEDLECLRFECKFGFIRRLKTIKRVKRKQNEIGRQSQMNSKESTLVEDKIENDTKWNQNQNASPKKKVHNGQWLKSDVRVQTEEEWLMSRCEYGSWVIYHGQCWQHSDVFEQLLVIVLPWWGSLPPTANDWSPQQPIPNNQALTFTAPKDQTTDHHCSHN